MVPYAGDNSVERLVARVTLAFFARYVLGDTSALSTLTQAGQHQLLRSCQRGPAAAIVISLVTKPRPEEELRGLVYALTPRPKDEEVSWYQRPVSLAVIVAVLLVGLNLIFW